MALQSPWASSAMSYPALVKHIRTEEPDYHGLKYDTNLVHLARWMLRKQPADRGTAAAIAAHLEISSPPGAPVAPPPVPGAPVAPPPSPAPLVPSPPSTPSPTTSTVIRQRCIVEAARAIQSSFRVSVEQRRLRRPTPPVQHVPLRPVDRCPMAPAQPLHPVDRRPTPPVHDVSAARIQVAFRNSLKARQPLRAPMSRLCALAQPKHRATPRRYAPVDPPMAGGALCPPAVRNAWV